MSLIGLGSIRTNSEIVNLRSRPDASGCKIACIGSSITQHATSWNAEYIKNDARGYMSWVNVLTNQRFYYATWPNDDASFFKGSNKGVSGQYSWEILDRVDDVINMGVDVCIVQNSTNEMASHSFETIIETTQKIYEAFYKAGIFVIALGVLPRDAYVTGWGHGSEARFKRNRVNAWKREYAQTHDGIVFVDPSKYLINPLDASGQPYAGMLWDGIHTSLQGGYHAAKAIAEVLNGLFPPVPAMVYGADNTFDAIHNPDGNLLKNPTFNGSTGTAGTNTTGTVPDDWRVELYSGSVSTIAVSTELKADKTGQALVVSMTPGGVDEVVHVRTNSAVTTYGVTAGDWYQGELDIEVDGNYAGFKAISLVVDDSTDAGMRGVDMSGYLDQTLTADSWRGRLRTPPVKVLSSLGLRFRLEMTLNGSAGAPVVRVSHPVMHKVIDPTVVLKGG